MLRTLGASVGFVLSFIGACQASCLDEAAIFAKSICGEISIKGRSSFVTAQGNLSAEGKNLVQKVLGNIGGEASIAASRADWENVTQEEVSRQLTDARGCAERMASTAIAQVCQKLRVYRTCAHPSFGISRWANTETISSTSGWRSGGGTREGYCNELLNATLRSRGLSAGAYEVGPYATGENSRMTWDRRAEYNYSCSFSLKSGPVFESRQDELCGYE